MDRYHVLELVGEGSFGRVFKGRRGFGGQVVALKFMPKVGRSEKELRSLKREIEIMRGLEHPNIVQLYDSFETETEVVVVTEYAEGQLFQILEDDGKLPESQVREIACQLVSALYYLHSHRILHRDMKPQNILLGKSGVVKLCDFGFARAMSVSTLVLTSIKGTPLYMSPELVEEKPYDHTADLWSLGCILYELHTGMPPFYTNSIFHLVQLIVGEAVKWPDMMSDTCMSFLKGLLMKDPQKRLSWPNLLHHPFVADGVLAFSDPGVFSPLTVTPSPDMMTQKLQQVAEKTVTASGGSRLLQKARELSNNSSRGKPADRANATITKGRRGNQRVHTATAATHQTAKPHHSDGSVTSEQSVMAADQILSSKIQPCMRSKHRGQISRDYEKQFPSVGAGPRLLRQSTDKYQQTTVLQQNVDSVEYWKELVQESDPFKEKKEQFNYTAIIPLLKVKLLALQLTAVEEAWHIHQPLKVLRNLLLNSDHEKTNHIGRELCLPHVLLDQVHDNVENSNYIKHPWIVSALGEMIIVLMIYWDKHPDSLKENQRLREEFTKPFVFILCEPDLIPLAPLAASVLSLCTQHDVDVGADMISVSSVMKNLLLDLFKPQLSLPYGWGLFDGLLSLLLNLLTKHDGEFEGSSLDPDVFLNLWKKIGTLLAKTTTDTDFCSAKGLFSFLSIALFVFTKDPYSCIPLFSVSESKCVYTLGRLLDTDCLHPFIEGSPLWLEVDQNHHRLAMMSCQLLCFPFALDLPLHAMSTILQLYDSCGIVERLVQFLMFVSWQVIQTIPVLQLELPLSLLSHLLLCDSEPSVCSLRKAACVFFTPRRDSLISASKHQTPATRTANSLLFDLLQLDVLWDSAAELLTLWSHVARCSTQPVCPQFHFEASLLHQALAHTHDQIRAGTCRLLGNLDPFGPSTSLQPDILRSITVCLHDSYLSVRRMACRAVGNWLGYIAVWAGFKMGWSNTRWSKKLEVSHSEASAAEQGVDDEERSRWIDEASRTAATLLSLVTDPDDITRCHSCAALGNLVCVDGAVSFLVEEEVFTLLLRVACTDSHNAVRKAAISTLSICSKQDTIGHVMK
uniref:serine/threonine-protein kinase 36 isoform X2 n=1 Tax=Solea senegalensis TaxID=28829 RepID=UPI001CD820BD|nr:serine/threonine-protein kinase 36 isoform X2 [Solea senegalensis]